MPSKRWFRVWTLFGVDERNDVNSNNNIFYFNTTSLQRSWCGRLYYNSNRIKCSNEKKKTFTRLTWVESAPECISNRVQHSRRIEGGSCMRWFHEFGIICITLTKSQNVFESISCLSRAREWFRFSWSTNMRWELQNFDSKGKLK